jgi:cytochrome oxidase Cu insertion factor (SCO1/SenC/PrrC family)
MRFVSPFCLGFALLVGAVPGPALAQKEKKSEEEFVKEKPTIGDKLPDVAVYTPDGKEFQTSDLRGHYTVLTFGCLT